MSDDVLLTASQLAKFLQVKVGTIYKWARSGEIPAIKTVGVWRFRLRDVEAWLDSNAQGNEEGTEDEREH